MQWSRKGYLHENVAVVEEKFAWAADVNKDHQKTYKQTTPHVHPMTWHISNILHVLGRAANITTGDFMYVGALGDSKQHELCV
jgi:hypothetical protein